MTRLLPYIYDARFDEQEVSAKDAVWRGIVRYLQRYVDSRAPLLDVAYDRGHFVRLVHADERWATDIRDVHDSLARDIHFVQAPGLDLAGVLPSGHFGTVFMSDYLEHLESGDAVIDQLRVVIRLLLPGGRLIVLQRNIRLVGSRYWDFIGHGVALTERSLLEAAELAGLATVDLVTRFLPYSTKGRLPAHPGLVRAHLAFRPAWWLMSKQTLDVGEKRS